MLIYESSISYSLVRLGDNVTLDSPDKVVDYMRDAFAQNPVQESFWTICLDRKHHPICRHLITLGTATGSLAHPREIFRPAFLSQAAAIVICHNHPSGAVEPSAADLQVTRVIREAARILQFDLLDHVIVGHPTVDPQGTGYYSFRAAGVL